MKTSDKVFWLLIGANVSMLVMLFMDDGTLRAATVLSWLLFVGWLDGR